nr:MAG: hypothetical protein [Microvirus sp.]
MSRNRVPLSISGGKLADPRQLTLLLLPCAEAGVSDAQAAYAVLPPYPGLEDPGRSRFRESWRRRSAGLALRPVYRLSFGAVAAMGDPYHVRGSNP